MLLAAGRSPGVIGTVNVRAAAWPGGAREASWTTPAALVLQSVIGEMRAAGTTDIVLEATSQALDQGRLEGCRFRVAGLTNITQDHLDAHGTMERYFDAKAILFERLMRDSGAVGVFFADQDEGRRMRARLRGARVLNVALTPEGARAAGGADVVVTSAAQSPDGWRLQLDTPIGPLDIASPLVGGFNLSNLALAIGMAIGRGLDRDAITGGLARLDGVPGRLERVANSRGVLCLVDYSHTPDALERAIAAVRPLTTGRVVVRVRLRWRSRQQQAPAHGADRGARRRHRRRHLRQSAHGRAGVDPRHDRCRRATRDASPSWPRPSWRRRRADFTARSIAAPRSGAPRQPAGPGDVLLIAGKGHEDYQILGNDQDPLRRSRRGFRCARGCDSVADHDMTAAPATHDLAFALAAMKGTLLQTGRAPRSDCFAGGAYDSRSVARRADLLRDAGRARRRVRVRGRGRGGGRVGDRRRRGPRRAGRVRERQRRRGRRSAGRARRAGVGGARALRRPRRRRHRLERQDHDQGADRGSARLGRSRAAHAGQPEHRGRHADHDPVGDRQGGVLGAGDGDARPRRDRAIWPASRGRTSASSPTSRARTSSGSARSKRSRTPRASSSTGSTARPTAAAASRCCRPAIA